MVYLSACEDYSEQKVRAALEAALSAVQGFSFVKPGMKVVIKTNLVAAAKPEAAVTTHPALLCALTDLLTERGATVVIGDSPGGLYNAVYVNRIYNACGMQAVKERGALLNQNFEKTEAENPAGLVLKRLTYTSYLDDCDAIIDCCKLKSHGMMGMSGAVKNMFGAIPGVMKPEYHYKFPDYADFANMIVDINEFFKDKLRLVIVDAVQGMEGNGPTAGTPRHIGMIAVSRSPYEADLVCAKIIGLTKDKVPTLQAALERGFTPAVAEQVQTNRPIADFAVNDYQHVAVPHSLLFAGDEKKPFKRAFSKLAGWVLRTRPVLRTSECVGCGVCKRICPAGAIQMEAGKAVIDRSRCIRCFCCQEFCPQGAMKVKRTLLARLALRL